VPSTRSVGLRAQAAVARGVAALPDPLLRRLLGPAVVRDGQQLHVEAQLALRLLELRGAPELATLDVADVRRRSRADAEAFGGPRLSVASVEQTTVRGANGPLPARLYVPEREVSRSMLVYFHGGGFVVGDLDTHDNLCRFLARQAGVRVLSVQYRLAPEHRFPAAIEDAVTAFRFTVEHAPELGTDPGRVAVGGDSAGGNLAAGVAMLAKAGECPQPALQLLLYPWLDLSSKRPSYRLFADGFYLREADLDWYRDHYLREVDDALDPRCSPLLAADFRDLAPAYVVTAGFDPLRDEGEEYAERLSAAGVPAALRRHEGLIHGFANAIGVGHAAREALLEAAGALRFALAAGIGLGQGSPGGCSSV
jgi:acetyl esterase